MEPNYNLPSFVVSPDHTNKKNSLLLFQAEEEEGKQMLRKMSQKCKEKENASDGNVIL
jgi:hypothetical protein